MIQTPTYQVPSSLDFASAQAMALSEADLLDYEEEDDLHQTPDQFNTSGDAGSPPLSPQNYESFDQGHHPFFESREVLENEPSNMANKTEKTANAMSSSLALSPVLASQSSQDDSLEFEEGLPPAVVLKHNNQEFVLFDTTTDSALFNSDIEIDMLYLGKLNDFLKKVKSHWEIDTDVSLRFSELEALEIREDSLAAEHYCLRELQDVQDFLSGSAKPLLCELLVHNVNTMGQIQNLIERAKHVYVRQNTPPHSIINQQVVNETDTALADSSFVLGDAHKRKLDSLDEVPTHKKLRTNDSQPQGAAAI